VRTVIVWTVIVAMGLSPSLAYAQPLPGAAAGQAKLDLGYVTPEAAGVVVAHPHRVLSAPQMEMLPVEVLSAAGLKELGIDPVEIEQVMAIAEPPRGPALPQAGVVVRMRGPLPQGPILGPLWERTAEGQLEGKSYRQAKGPLDFSIFHVNDRTLLAAHNGLLRKMLANHAHPQPGAMSQLLGRISEPPDLAAVLLVEPFQPLVALPLAMAPLPPQFAQLKR
jgi:hypothetical protein